MWETAVKKLFRIDGEGGGGRKEGVKDDTGNNSNRGLVNTTQKR